jgi:uncharacterized protein with PIN domain
LAKKTKEPELKESSGTRVVCPKCGSIRVRSSDEKGKVMTYIGGMPVYKKLWVCKDCGNQWG